jgi:hypothetical protein
MKDRQPTQHQRPAQWGTATSAKTQSRAKGQICASLDLAFLQAIKDFPVCASSRSFVGNAGTSPAMAISSAKSFNAPRKLPMIIAAFARIIGNAQDAAPPKG